MIRIVVIRPEYKPAWHSLSEILPALDRAWAGVARPGQVEVRREPLRASRLPALLRRLERADVVVFTFLDASALRLIRILRRVFSTKQRLVIHLHGNATSGGIGLRDVESCLNDGDLWIAASRADARALRLCYANARVAVVPFPILRAGATGARRRGKAPPPILYCGRLSEQKNLHTLLLAVAIARRAAPRLVRRLELFGAADGLGSLNMALHFPNYGEYLRALARDLGLADVVRWRGHVPTAELNRMLRRRPHLLASASLHSDENFGMAVGRSLIAGNRAVLSRWGGSADFARVFGARARSVPVRSSPVGPYLCPVEFADELLRALEAGAPAGGGAGKRVYQVPAVSAGLSAAVAALLRAKGARRALRRTPLNRRIERGAYRQPGFERLHSFTGYDDPKAWPFLRAYGMRYATRAVKPGEPVLVPWASRRGRRVVVADPHRGKFSRDASARAWLRRCGYLLSLPRPRSAGR